MAEGRRKCIFGLNHLVIYSDFSLCENANSGILNELKLPQCSTWEKTITVSDEGMYPWSLIFFLKWQYDDLGIAKGEILINNNA